MTKPSHADIDIILNERFPLRYMVEAAATIEGMQERDGFAPPLAKPSAPSPVAMKAEMDAYRQHLESLSALQVAELAALSGERLAAKAAAERARKEAARFYNQPSAKADFEFWCKADYWTADEAAALLLGRDPRVVSPAALAAELAKSTGLLSLGKPPAPADFHRQYDGLRTLLQRASGLQGLALTPSAALEWADRTKAVVVPVTLASAVTCSTDTRQALADVATSMGSAPAQPGGTLTKWTPELLDQLREFRVQHGTKAAAAKFGISEPRVRQLLPRSQKKITRPSSFDVLTHHLK